MPLQVGWQVRGLVKRQGDLGNFQDDQVCQEFKGRVLSEAVLESRIGTNRKGHFRKTGLRFAASTAFAQNDRNVNSLINAPRGDNGRACI